MESHGKPLLKDSAPSTALFCLSLVDPLLKEQIFPMDIASPFEAISDASLSLSCVDGDCKDSEEPEDSDGLWAVKKLLASRPSKEAIEYLVQWEDFENDDENTWEPEANIADVLLIEEFDASGRNKHVELLEKRSRAGRAGYLVRWTVRWKAAGKKNKAGCLRLIYYISPDKIQEFEEHQANYPRTGTKKWRATPGLQRRRRNPC